MIAFGSKKRLFLGSWILVALLLTGYNGATLISLFNPPLVKHSDEVKLASRKWQQLKEKTSFASKILKDFDLDLILSKFVPGYHEQGIKGTRAQKLNGESELPLLAGIMRLSDVHGNKRLLAVIDGKAYVEGEQVKGFTIQNITEKGVGLTKVGTSWFIQAPEVYFSMDNKCTAYRDESKLSQ